MIIPTVGRKVKRGSISKEEMQHIRRTNEKFRRLSLTDKHQSLEKEDLEFFPKIDELVYSKRETDKRWFVAKVIATATDKGAVIVELRKASNLFVLIAHRG